jgi:hypothetical protein
MREDGEGTLNEEGRGRKRLRESNRRDIGMVVGEEAVGKFAFENPR